MDRRRRGAIRLGRAPSPLSGVRRSALRPCQAGARPAPTPVSSVTTPRNRKTLRSGARSVPAGASIMVPIVGSAQYANSRPTAAEIAPSARLSVTSCRTRRPRLAPSAARTPISRSRVMAVEMSTVATFAHASSSTSAITANTKTVVESASDAAMRPRPACGSSRTRTADSPAVAAGSPAATPLSCVSASASETPGSNRPKTWIPVSGVRLTGAVARPAR